MSEFCDISAMNSVPEQCTDCPLIGFRQELASKLAAEGDDQLAKLDMLGDKNLDNLVELHNLVSSPIDQYEAIQADLTAILSIIELMPDSADMKLTDFLRIYRTNTNGLGNQAFDRLVEVVAGDELAEQELTVRDAIEISRKAAEGFKSIYDESPIVKEQGVQDLISSNDGITERIEQSKDRIRGALQPILETHKEAIDELVTNCPDGVKERTKGIFKKRVIKYCGSKALK